MGFWDDFGSIATSTGSGAATGGIMGGAAGGVGAVPGAIVGGGLGLLTGIFGTRARNQQKEAQQRAMQQAMSQLDALSKRQYENRMADLQKTMAFFDPAQSEWNRLYGGALPNQGPPGGTAAAQALVPSAAQKYPDAMNLRGMR